MSRSPTGEELSLAETLLRTFPLFRAVMVRAAQSAELGSLERARLLHGLRDGPCRAGVLAQAAKISPSTLSEVVEALESEGLVRREAESADRRAVRVALTPEGRRQLQRFEHAAAVAIAERLATLSAAEKQRLRAAFADVHTAFSPEAADAR
ncbi:MAG TPA: MarR family transcriptional regulator [Candidatus Limnocylindria bacterium]|nr:MarR family transcriptional regulator [Candidatus Limnocylindria bacterium]